MPNYFKTKLKLRDLEPFRIGFFLLCLIWMNNIELYAQSIQVTGVVTDSKTGELLPGVNIVVQGTTSGTITDLNGQFKINVPSSASILVFSYVGYITEQMSVEGKTEINVSMVPDITSLDDVVVIGYGTIPKKDLTGAVTSIGEKDLRNIPVPSTLQGLAGKLAGVQITTTDGAPDAEIIVRVRGGGSVTGDNSPLYIIDGFPVSSLNTISLNDIKTIDILKDASSTAIYGSQGANGVVIITTKSFQGGKTTVSYNNFFQHKKLSKKMDVLSPYEFVLYNYEYAALRGETSADMANFERTFGVYDDLELYKYQKGHDYQEDFFGADVASFQHNLSINGGSEKTKFSLSGNYNKDNGLTKFDNYSRLNLNLRLSHQLAKNVTFEFNGRVAGITANGSGTSGGTYKIRSTQAVTRMPVNGLDDVSEVDVSSMTEQEYEDYLESRMSLSDRAFQYWRKKADKNYNVTTGLNWEIIKGLTFRNELGYEMNFNQLKRYYGPTTSQSQNDGQSLPIAQWTKEDETRYRIANTLTYKFKLAEIHNADFMIGQEIMNTSRENNFMMAKFFSREMSPEKIFANIGLSSGVNNFMSSSYVAPDDRLLAFFGRFNYTLKGRYYATFTLRTDGSSRFSEKNRWGTFPSVALAWRISDEGFMKEQSIISNLKWRLSYGVAGNKNIGSLQYMLTYRILAADKVGNSIGKYYGVGEITNPPYVTTNTELPNPDLKWETTYTRNTGLDFGLFNERISGTLDFYSNTTKDLLIQSKIVAPGYETQQRNVGQTSNKGLELTLKGLIVKNNKFSLSGTLNIAFNRGKVDKLADGLEEQVYNSGWAGTDIKGSDDYRVRVGEPVGLMYGFVTDGYYTTEDFDPNQSVNGAFVLKPGVPTTGLYGGVIGIRPGTLKLKDLNHDGVIDLTDRDIIGNAAPKHTGGFGLEGTYRGFDLTLFFNWVYGNQIYNANKIASSQNYRIGYPSYPNLLNNMNSDNRYTYLDPNGNVVTDLATLREMNEVGDNKKAMWSPHSFGSAVVIPHSWAIEDGSFLRLQNITLGYTVPLALTQKLKMSQFRVFCTLYNVWVWTKYTGYDPEVGTAVRNNSYNALTPGVDYSSYPKSFSYTFGVNLTF